MSDPVDFKALFDLLPNPYMLLDRELRYVTANQAYLRVTSARLEDLIGRHILDAFPHDPLDPQNSNARQLRESLQRVIDTRQPDAIALIPYRVPRQTARGLVLEERSWSATHTPILENGEVAFVLQHTVDVTDLEQLKKAAAGTLDADAPSVMVEQEEAGLLGRARRVQETNLLIEAERSHLRRLFQQAPGFMAFLRGSEHVFELTNAAYDQLVGHRDVLGKRVRDALPEVKGQGFVEALDRVYQAGEPFLGRGVRAVLQRTRGAPPEEVFLDFVYQPIVGADGKVAGIFVQGNDITPQKHLELDRLALLERERQERARAEMAEQEYRFLAEAIPQQVWTARPDGQLDFVSQRVLDYFDSTTEQVLGDGWHDVIHPDELPLCLERWRRSLATGDVYEVMFRLRRHDGAYRWHLARALALRGADGSILRWYGTNTDIDEAQRARDELHDRARFEEQLIGIVSHDLRNPLQSIQMSASLLLRRGALDDQQGKGLARIITSAERAGRMIRDFLDFTQTRSVGRIPIQPAPANLREIARQVVDEVHLTQPERAVTVLHQGDEQGRWDADRIAQVIGNLVANAFQHSPRDAVVRVTTRGGPQEALIEVHNEGPPISPQARERLFAPFQRGPEAQATSGRSIGLGLYISRQIVDAHGGTIEVESAAGSGTRFIVRLPRNVMSGTSPVATA